MPLLLRASILGSSYGGQFNYVGGSTVTVSGSNFTRATPCPGGRSPALTTDRLQFLLMDANKAGESQRLSRTGHGMELRVGESRPTGLRHGRSDRWMRFNGTVGPFRNVPSARPAV